MKKNNAKSFADTWYYFTEKGKKDSAKHWLTLTDYIIHEVGCLRVIDFHDSIIHVVNSETLFVHFFDTIEEAMNFCLDSYEASKEKTQTKLF